MKYLYLLLLFVLFTNCASPYYTSSQSNGNGLLEIEFAYPGRATVLIDDLKIDTPKKWVKSVTIDSLEPGEYEVSLSVVRNGRKTLHEEIKMITIHSDQKSTMIVNNPQNDASYWALTLGTSVIALYIANYISGQ